MDAELRTLRDRQEQARQALDRLAYAPPGSADMLVQVFDNGAIPTTVDKYFACHPVDPGGAECEGCIPTFAAESGTVFVLVVGTVAPVAGDYLIAKPVGGRWVAEGKGAPSECLWTFSVRDDCVHLPIPGSVVSVSQGGIEIGTCTTDGQVASVARVSTGSSYTSPPTVTITGLGSGATATANMQLGTLTRTAGGTGYTNGTYTGLGTFTGGGGSGATFTFSVSGGVVQPSLPIVTRGSGYTSLPTPNFSAAGAGTGATASVTLNVGSLVLTAGGTGYIKAGLTMSGGGGSGATGTATAASTCVLDVPAGDYDVEITPPSGSGYDSYSNTLTHTCGQTTTVDLANDGSHFCSSCGDCTSNPNQVDITFTFGVSYTGFHWPNLTLTWNAINSRWESDPFDSDTGTNDRQMFLTCDPSNFQYVLSWDTIPAGGGGGPFARAIFGADTTCVPFFIPNGRFFANTSPTFGSWTGAGV